MALTLRNSTKAQHTGHRKPRKYDTQGKDNASQVLRTELRDWCVFHQSRTTAGPSPRPLVVVVQNEGMREVMLSHGKEVLFVEKNFEGVCVCVCVDSVFP